MDHGLYNDKFLYLSSDAPAIADIRSTGYSSQGTLVIYFMQPQQLWSKKPTEVFLRPMDFDMVKKFLVPVLTKPKSHPPKTEDRFSSTVRIARNRRRRLSTIECNQTPRQWALRFAHLFVLPSRVTSLRPRRVAAYLTLLSSPPRPLNRPCRPCLLRQALLCMRGRDLRSRSRLVPRTPPFPVHRTLGLSTPVRRYSHGHGHIYKKKRQNPHLCAGALSAPPSPAAAVPGGCPPRKTRLPSPRTNESPCAETSSYKKRLLPRQNVSHWRPLSCWEIRAPFLILARVSVRTNLRSLTPRRPFPSLKTSHRLGGRSSFSHFGASLQEDRPIPYLSHLPRFADAASKTSGASVALRDNITLA
ncbi:hypothetical protein SODALDRAFT_362401 [Sodiomyces alkalinus F11]|uniref:Uncharacterized protein n=1 Tax=Sodiomyces alkalinus (strain CBS 110278 / VKM F-3762 / F11) TaxID=1314773 RepID=A0A3N2PQE5_SODAK|nr:hypothetical protein SODALDRAFT_362401 [Sodiomyces alkalinus F11]ROT36586.1 hypothetical protein SODALDRAFT_362401 [Sodiomyces alkalinus F11]